MILTECDGAVVAQCMRNVNSKSAERQYKSINLKTVQIRVLNLLGV